MFGERLKEKPLAFNSRNTGISLASATTRRERHRGLHSDNQTTV